MLGNHRVAAVPNILTPIISLAARSAIDTAYFTVAFALFRAPKYNSNKANVIRYWANAKTK